MRAKREELKFQKPGGRMKEGRKEKERKNVKLGKEGNEERRKDTGWKERNKEGRS